MHFSSVVLPTPLRPIRLQVERQIPQDVALAVVLINVLDVQHGVLHLLDIFFKYLSDYEAAPLIRPTLLP